MPTLHKPHHLWVLKGFYEWADMDVNAVNLAAADNFSGLARANPWVLRTRSGNPVSMYFLSRI